MKCHEVKPLFSACLDGDVTGAQRHKITHHMETCTECSQAYQALAQTQKLVAGLQRRPVPAALALRLRVAASQLVAQSRRSRLEGLQVRWSNALSGLMFPATAGLVSAVLFFGLIVGFIAVPLPVQASSDDVPFMLYTPPQLSSSPFITTVGSLDGSLVVETYVDANGRVEDYRIISAPAGTERLIPQLDNMMIFTTFRPAMNLGRPTAGRVVLSFSGVNVKG
jgi:putative zinc finger protein